MDSSVIAAAKILHALTNFAGTARRAIDGPLLTVWCGLHVRSQPVPGCGCGREWAVPRDACERPPRGAYGSRSRLGRRAV
jgi:hypothetical protein